MWIRIDYSSRQLQSETVILYGFQWFYTCRNCLICEYLNMVLNVMIALNPTPRFPSLCLWVGPFIRAVVVILQVASSLQSWILMFMKICDFLVNFLVFIIASIGDIDFRRSVQILPIQNIMLLFHFVLVSFSVRELRAWPYFYQTGSDFIKLDQGSTRKSSAVYGEGWALP